MIKLIAADMDGTLLDDDARLPEETFGLIRELRERGVRFEVARPQRNVARVLGLLGVGADLNIREA